MAEKEKTQNGPSKAFMTAGPTLHYSHANVTLCWLLAIFVYTLGCLLWSKILAGSFAPFDLNSLLDLNLWHLDRYLLAPISIFEYPGQIAVLGLLMGMLAVMPPLMSQLLSFAYGIPFLLALAFIADLPAFAGFVMLSCIASSCRPLRFRSRFIAIALCMAPQLVYWACFGPLRNMKPVELGYSCAPWICAWLVAIVFAGIVIGVGHFTRYRPGLNWILGSVTLIAAVLIFNNKIGFDELAFQQYVAKYNPVEIEEFRDHSLKEPLDRTVQKQASIFLSSFYSPDPQILNKQLLDEIQTQVSHERWPGWFIVPPNMNFPAKRLWLLSQYDLFIEGEKPFWLPQFLAKKFESRRQRSRRMPIALYYKAILSEMAPDPIAISEKQVLHFYSDYPFFRNRVLWYELYSKFGLSTESIEARRRVAMHWAGQGAFDAADHLVQEAQSMAALKLKETEQQSGGTGGFFIAFITPQTTAITRFELIETQRKLAELHAIIAKDVLPADEAGKRRVAEFVMLDPHSLDYAAQLDRLLTQTGEKDPLRDNILLAKALLIKDWQMRSVELRSIHDRFPGTDGGITALYELGLLKVRIWQEAPAANGKTKRKLLDEAKATLTSFIALYPSSFFTAQAQSILKGLPASE
jgi:hypothetical protein